MSGILLKCPLGLIVGFISWRRLPSSGKWVWRPAEGGIQYPQVVIEVLWGLCLPAFPSQESCLLGNLRLSLRGSLSNYLLGAAFLSGERVSSALVSRAQRT